MEIKNAIIKSTVLGSEDHGIFTCYLHLDYGGGGQGFGGYGLDSPVFDQDDTFLRREGTAYGIEFIKRVMETVGVTKWEDMKGKHIRVIADRVHVEAIGHIIKDKWFNPKKDLSYLLEEA